MTSYWWTKGAFKESLRRGVSTPSSPWVRLKMDHLLLNFPHLRKTFGYCLEWTVPIGTFPVGASFLIVIGTTKGLVWIGSKTRVFFEGCLFKGGTLLVP